MSKTPMQLRAITWHLQSLANAGVLDPQAREAAKTAEFLIREVRQALDLEWTDDADALMARIAVLRDRAEQVDPMMVAIAALQRTYAAGDVWGEHPTYPREDWRHEVDNNETHLGYWEWVVHTMEAQAV